MKRLFFLSVCVFLWVGYIPTYGQSPDPEILLFNSTSGLFMLESSSQQLTLWLPEEIGYEYQPLLSLADGRVLLINLVDGTLYTVTRPEQTPVPLTSSDNVPIAIDPVFDVVLLPDGNSFIFAQKDTRHIYRYDSEAQVMEEIALNVDLSGCGDHIRPVDEALLNNFHFFLGWSAENLLAPVGCNGMVTLAADGMPSTSLYDPAQSPDGEYLAGTANGALVVVAVPTGIMQTMQFGIFHDQEAGIPGDFQRWWWSEDSKGIFFSMTTPMEEYTVDVFPDTTLAEAFLGEWKPSLEPFIRYHTALYYWT